MRLVAPGLAQRLGEAQQVIVVRPDQVVRGARSLANASANSVLTRR